VTKHMIRVYLAIGDHATHYLHLYHNVIYVILVFI